MINAPRGNIAIPAPEKKPGGTEKPEPAAEIFDHPTIGGRVTVFMLMYGDYFDLHKKSLDALIRTCPPGRVDLRIGSNAVCPQTMSYINDLGSLGTVHLHYYHESNDKKYPVMREMFYDRENPIDTKWLVWLDDDSICVREDWLGALCQEIVNWYPQNYHMFGPHYFSTLKDSQVQWVKEAPWYKGLEFRDKSGKPTSNGNRVHFCTGSAWALSAEAMRTCMIPDERLQHNGGDIFIGEQLYQNGFKMKHWNGDRRFINWSSVPRRGLNEKHPGQR